MIEERLAELGIELPAPVAPVGLYRAALVAGPFLFLSGQLPFRDGALIITGKVGGDVSVEQAQDAARVAVLAALATVKDAVGSLDRVERVVRLTGYVASADGFTRQTLVMNGASELLRDVFGEERGIGVRAAVGVAELPSNAPLEIELTFLLTGG